MAAGALRSAHGSTLTNCAAGGNDFEGINAGSGSVLTNCSARDNDGSYGILAATGSTLTNCTAIDNTGIYGIFAGEGSTLQWLHRLQQRCRARHPCRPPEHDNKLHRQREQQRRGRLLGHFR